ncbi:hypothetical protein DL546_002173 [Coniochaeta pulveracea]|uniref:Conidiation-specific expression protein n=1 Tax=Coniochaeta pulveracea TaxID=177199 RepID=A0A420XXC8_9PEZI|nr:hypothetical protein DL546_002173 [Coniochaeta pulveracea]
MGTAPSLPGAPTSFTQQLLRISYPNLPITKSLHIYTPASDQVSTMSSPNDQRASSISSTESDTSNHGAPTSRRKSSSGLYANLNAINRGDDPASVARRQSMHDQRPATGFFGQMWNNYVRGPSSPSK